MINNIGDSTVEIKRRLTIARSTVQSMQNIWKSCGISISLKVRLLNAVAFFIATYGCESWAMTKSDRKRVDAFEMWLRAPSDSEEEEEDSIYYGTQMVEPKGRNQIAPSHPEHSSSRPFVWIYHPKGGPWSTAIKWQLIVKMISKEYDGGPTFKQYTMYIT